MSTQYDAIGGKYQKTKATPVARLEVHNLQLALKPYIKGANVLDLACGTGFYSRKMIEWGAKSVTGVDISPTMIDYARDSLDSTQSRQITFCVADCAIPTIHESGPFDVVLGAWLLNYAADGSQLTSMFENICQNLKDDGVFVGVCPWPTNDIRGHIQKQMSKPQGKYNFDIKLVAEVPDGARARITIHLGPDDTPIELDNFYLRKDIWESSARSAGLKGNLDWKMPEIIPLDDLEPDYLDGYEDVSAFAILVLAK